MLIKFADTFLESLQNISNSGKWYHWQFYREKYRDLRSFLNSFFTYSYRSTMIKDWQFDTTFPLMKLQLEKLCYVLEHAGREIDETRLPKIVMIKRTIELLDHYINADYISQAEKLLNRQVSDYNIFNDMRTECQLKADSEIYDLANAIEQNQWNELWETIRINSCGWWD